jgi:hypothetical protein
MNRKIIVVPWIVNSSLNSVLVRNCRPGRANSLRMSSALMPPRRKNTKVVPMYSRPIFLWLVVVIQSRRPPRRSGVGCSATVTPT